MEISDIFDCLLLTILLRIYWAYRKVMEERRNLSLSSSNSGNSEFFSCCSENESFAAETQPQIINKNFKKLEENENFATSTPTLRSEFGKKILKDQFLKNIPDDLDLKFDKMCLDKFKVREEELSSKLRNMTMKSSGVRRTRRNIRCNLNSSENGIIVKIASPETRRRNAQLLDEFFPSLKKVKATRTTLRI